MRAQVVQELRFQISQIQRVVVLEMAIDLMVWCPQPHIAFELFEKFSFYSTKFPNNIEILWTRILVSNCLRQHPSLSWWHRKAADLEDKWLVLFWFCFNQICVLSTSPIRWELIFRNATHIWGTALIND